MARKCKTCAHDQIKAIDKAIFGKQSFTGIGKKYGLDKQSVTYHANNHLKPLIEKANKAAEKQLVDSIVKYRKEVNYAPLDKCKWMQDRIATALDTVSQSPFNLSDRVALMRELRGWFDIENKLAGNYRDGAYYLAEREQTASIEKVLQSYSLWLERNPNTSPQERADAIVVFAKGGNVDETELAKRIGIEIVSEAMN